MAAGGQHLRDGSDAAAQLQVRAGTMDHIGVLARQAPDPLAVHPDAMGQSRTRARDAHRIQIGQLVVSRFPLHGLQLQRRLGGVGVDHRAGLAGQVAHAA